jgi:DNA-binding response OmpR family regulator
MKLLLVEDDDLLAESLAETLQDDGYSVDTATRMRVAVSTL